MTIVCVNRLSDRHASLRVCLMLVFAWALPATRGRRVYRRIAMSARRATAHHTIHAAIDAALPGDVIRIQGDPVYTERLTIANKSLGFSTALCTPIEGRPDDAPDAPSGGSRVSISGSGGASTSVFTISGSSTVSLQNLEITDGHSSNGAGIVYNGSGALTLRNVIVRANVANAGAGIYLVRLYTTDPQHPVKVQGNNASNVGGGFYIHSENDTLRYQSLLLLDALVNENSARNGAALYLDDYDYFGPGVYPPHWCRSTGASTPCMSRRSPGVVRRSSGAARTAATRRWTSTEPRCRVPLSTCPREPTSSDIAYACRTTVQRNCSSRTTTAM